MLAHVCDVSHREAEEDERERECVLREIVGECLFGAAELYHICKCEKRAGLSILAALSLYRSIIMTSGAQ